MTKKSMRLAFIRNVLQTTEVHDQEELLAAMRAEGIDCTQATLSRDLNQLRAIKEKDSAGNYKYVLPDNSKYIRRVQRQNHISIAANSSFLRLDIGGELIVLHTMPGFAMSLATSIDSYHFADIAGTISGDDTILVITKQNSDRANIIKELALLIPELNAYNN